MEFQMDEMVSLSSPGLLWAELNFKLRSSNSEFWFFAFYHTINLLEF